MANTKTKPKHAARKKPAATKALSTKDKQRLAKPSGEFATQIGHLLDAWKTNKRALRVANRSPAGLGSLARKAERAAQKEAALREKLEAKLRPLTDARLLAEDAAWHYALDVYAVAKAQTRTAPELARAFAPFAHVFARGKKK